MPDNFSIDAGCDPPAGAPFLEDVYAAFVGLIRTREQNQEKWAETYAACRARAVAQICTRWPLLADQAVGVFHQAIQAVYQAINNGPVVRVDGAWFFTVLEHTAAGEAKKLATFRRRFVLYSDMTTLDGVSFDPVATAATPVCDDDDKQALHKAISQLIPDEREVIALTMIDGMDNERLAANLNRSVAAVKALRWRAVRHLRHIIGGDCNE